MESLAPEVAPFGISTTIVNPGMFRTELLTKDSATYVEPSIEDYAERDAAQRSRPCPGSCRQMAYRQVTTRSPATSATTRRRATSSSTTTTTSATSTASCESASSTAT